MQTDTTATQPQRLLDACLALNLSLECSAPMPGVDDATSKDGKAWPHIAYTVTLKRDGKLVWSGPYKLGVGHVKFPRKFEAYPGGFTQDETRALNTIRINPGAQLKDKQLHASVAAKLAAAQKVAPKLADVVSSLLSDGEASFDRLSFEEWCGILGYDTDSRKAEEIYRACDAIGRTLERALGREAIKTLREAAQDF